MKSPGLYICLWIDTATTLGWHEAGEAVSPSIVLSLGFLYNEDEKFMRVSGSWSDGHHANITVILKESILFSKKFTLPFLAKWFKGEK